MGTCTSAKDSVAPGGDSAAGGCLPGSGSLGGIAGGGEAETGAWWRAARVRFESRGRRSSLSQVGPSTSPCSGIGGGNLIGIRCKCVG
ncbi:unnamed protein product [Linum trigynum]|uniref:Uncharacterized protein n=1 Tax=Linum trigynum TaxID=586398 RepID=A0AAV2DAR7_9ROSI